MIRYFDKIGVFFRIPAGLLIFCLLTGVTSQPAAQTVLISKDLSIRPSDIYHPVGQIGDQIFMFHEKGNKKSILVFDSNLGLTRTHELDLEKQNAVAFGASILESHLNFIYYYKSRSDLYMVTSQYNDALEVVRKDTLFTIENVLLTPGFEMVESEDLSKVIIYHFSGQKSIVAYCRDLRDHTKLWEEELYLDRKSRREFDQIVLTNEGQGYFFFDTSPKALRKKRFNLDILLVDKYTKKPVKYALEVTETKPSSKVYTYDNINKKIIVAGLYGENPHSRSDGVFCLKVDGRNPQKRNFHKYAFDEELYFQLSSKKRKKKDGVEDLHLTDVVLRQDGGLLLVNEIQRIHQRYGGATANRRGGYRSWTDYYNEEIVLHSIHPDGKDHWELVLPKKQFSQDDEGAYSSFFVFQNKSAVRLFYNDEISSGNTVSEYIISGSGRSLRKSVMSTKNQKLRLRFADAVQLDGTSLLVLGDFGNRVNLVKISYNS